VSKYFETHRDDWDAIYSARVGSLRWRMNRQFRKAVLGRMALALEALSDIEGRTVLDIGCGTGELGIRLAERGAARVVGIDAAAEMIRTASDHAQRRGVGTKCEFIHADFLTHAFSETFTYSAALGVMDYVADAEGFLRRMWSLTDRRLAVSFPQSVPPRSWMRRVWHGLHGSRIYYYTSDDMQRLPAALSPALTQVHTMPGSDRTHVLVCDKSAVPAS
jgi:cyclopropane fatty-acyl-phospholipid synthase-like methyltransferase